MNAIELRKLNAARHAKQMATLGVDVEALVPYKSEGPTPLKHAKTYRYMRMAAQGKPSHRANLILSNASPYDNSLPDVYTKAEAAARRRETAERKARESRLGMFRV